MPGRHSASHSVNQSVGQSVKGSKIRLKANAIRVNEQCMQNCLPAPLTMAMIDFVVVLTAA